jgi:predicted RNase H-like nuclease
MLGHPQLVAIHVGGSVGVAVGVDGCRFGWIAVGGTSTPLDIQLFSTIEELLAHYDAPARVFVDVPIGLPWASCPTRPCDMLARRALLRRHVCVFSPPSRLASRADTKDEARQLNMSAIGKSLSEQAWGICPKVAEVDKLLLADSNARERVREIHPEICFWSLNGERPLDDAKRTNAGINARLEILSKRIP